MLISDGTNLLVFWVENSYVSGAVLSGTNPGIALHDIAGKLPDSSKYDYSVTVDADGVFHIVWVDGTYPASTGLWHSYAPS